jgi:transcriptional regulator with XRE-family HTH domain
MPPLSHIVKVDASAKFHNLSVGRRIVLLHNVNVTKNGGPNFLKAWREFRKLSQEELAEKVGTTASMISMLETEQRGLSAKWLRRLAPALGTTAGHLLDLDPNAVDTDVIDIWAAISDRDKGRAMQVLRAFKTGTDDR